MTLENQKNSIMKAEYFIKVEINALSILFREAVSSSLEKNDAGNFSAKLLIYYCKRVYTYNCFCFINNLGNLRLKLSSTAIAPQ